MNLRDNISIVGSVQIAETTLLVSYEQALVIVSQCWYLLSLEISGSVLDCWPTLVVVFLFLVNVILVPINEDEKPYNVFLL